MNKFSASLAFPEEDTRLAHVPVAGDIHLLVAAHGREEAVGNNQAWAVEHLKSWS